MIGFLFGTWMLTLWCILIGEISSGLIGRLNKTYYDDLEHATVKMHNLSIKAILSKDKQSYQACNRQANEAFGRYFFAMTARGASTLWILPFAIAWMDFRFHDVAFDLAFPIPFIGDSVGFAGVFILIYLLSRIVYGKYKFQKMASVDPNKEKMIRWSDIDRMKEIPS
jgi:hypothetical protein